MPYQLPIHIQLPPAGHPLARLDLGLAGGLNSKRRLWRPTGTGSIELTGSNAADTTFCASCKWAGVLTVAAQLWSGRLG